MIPDNLKQIINLLAIKTKNRKAVWSKGSGIEQFKLSLKEGIAITISAWQPHFNETEYEVVVFNSNGNAIERFSTDFAGTSSEDFEIMRNLHKAANDSYYKVEETMDALLQSIGNQDVIGIEDNEILPEFNGSNDDDDDDLPF